GRSIMMIRSTKEQDGNVRSNIRWSYGHVTIPRHLRDMVVTEYGIADLRGRSDAEVIAALVEVADSRFQDELVKEAKRAGKISKSIAVPDDARPYLERMALDRPETLKERLMQRALVYALASVEAI